MNYIENIAKAMMQNANKTAIVHPLGQSITFMELYQGACLAQGFLHSYDLKKGDKIAFIERFDLPSLALVLASLSSGLVVVYFEEWVSPEFIEKQMDELKISYVFASEENQNPLLKKINGKTLDKNKIFDYPQDSLDFEDMQPSDPAVVEFTTGTTGPQKSIIFTHENLEGIQQQLLLFLGPEVSSGPSLLFYEDQVLLNLALGKISILLPEVYDTKWLTLVDNLPRELQPESLACGPGFLKFLLQSDVKLSGLKLICVGGALSDISLFEEAFARWPHASWVHVYGCTEAEPVAISDAKIAVEKSKSSGYFQTLFLGEPVPNMLFTIEGYDMYVKGKHVVPDNPEKQTLKLGDHVKLVNDELWYQGRNFQKPDDFLLEQAVYNFINSSNGFIYRENGTNSLTLYLDHSLKGNDKIKQISVDFPSITNIVFTKIYRDIRHRARIDRPKSMQSQL